jgi:deferrochelatase/peroxidase EfeB
VAVNLDLITGPMDATDPRFAPLFGNLQGNILKSHGRNYTVNLFLTFVPGREAAVKAWIGDFARRYVTSFLRQLQETAEFKTNGISGRLFATFSLSAAGYEYLGLDADAFVEEVNPFTPVRFKDGMAKASAALGDPDPATWPLNKDGAAHALILLADEVPVAPTSRLGQVQAMIMADLRRRGITARIETVLGTGLRDENNQPLEHFGYRDGISQPLFFADEVEQEADRFGTEEWDPSAAPSLVLVKDPFAEKEDCFGSYFVFRKLEQRVKDFKKAEENLGFGERGGAMAVGRFENGVPLTETGSEQAVGYRDFNDFHYHADAADKPGTTPPEFEYRRCPFHGHIRKTNPRGDTARVFFPQNGIPNVPTVEATDATERGHRIARRGITFGTRDTYKRLSSRRLVKVGQPNPMAGFLPGDDELEAQKLDPNHPTGGVGLLFQCYQRSISNQFAFIQIAWANNPDFPEKATGIDPIIGQGDPNKPPQEWAKAYDATAGREKKPFGGFVTMEGGDFFFTPSVPFLLAFGDAPASVSADVREYVAVATSATP